MSLNFQYVRPKSLAEALRFLGDHGPESSLVAGGTDFSISVRKGTLSARYVVDVSRLEEMRYLRRENGFLGVGAAATFSEIVESPLVNEHAPVLAKGGRCVGSLQIRNVGTIGGNVVNASPAADGVPPLMAHNASAVVEAHGSQRVVPLGEIITAPYRTSLKPGEIVTGFLLECPGSGYGCSYHRVARRKALSIARMNVAVLSSLSSDGTIGDIRIAVGSVTPSPCRMKDAEDHLSGKRPDLDVLVEAAEKVSAEMIKQSGVRASTAYKKPAVEGLVLKALAELLLYPE